MLPSRSGCGETWYTSAPMKGRRARAAPRVRHETRRIEISGTPARIVVVADTHGSLHPKAAPLIYDLAPSAIIHAGDVGVLEILDELGQIAPTIAVRGNIDPRSSGLFDIVTVELVLDGGDGPGMTILLIHEGIARARLRAQVRRMAFERDAQLVICGHSHIPWIGRDGEVAVLNPGSAGPRRFTLPITFAVVEITSEGASLFHIDCEAGTRWDPSGSKPQGST